MYLKGFSSLWPWASTPEHCLKFFFKMEVETQCIWSLSQSKWVVLQWYVTFLGFDEYFQKDAYLLIISAIISSMEVGYETWGHCEIKVVNLTGTLLKCDRPPGWDTPVIWPASRVGHSCYVTGLPGWDTPLMWPVSWVGGALLLCDWPPRQLNSSDTCQNPVKLIMKTSYWWGQSEYRVNTVLIKSNAQLINEFFVGPLQQVGQIWKRCTIGGWVLHLHEQ